MKKNEKTIKTISKEFNNQLESTGHFGTFSTNNINNINNDNHYFVNTFDRNRNIRTKYDKIFSETNPTNIGNKNKNNFSFNNINVTSDIDNTNLSIENIKFLPNYFYDIEEALKKSNNNVLELQKTVKEKINEEKKLKNIIEQLKGEKNKLSKKNEELVEALKKSNKNVLELKETVKGKINEEKKIKSIIEQLKGEKNTLGKKNEELMNKINKYEENIKKYQNVKGILETEINNLGEDIQDSVKTLQKQLKIIQDENSTLISSNKSLSDKNTKLKNLNKKILGENLRYINEIKKLKTDIKNHLYEKINILKINNINKEQKIVNNKLNNIINDNKIKIKSLSKENDNLKNLHKNYQYLSDDYKRIYDDIMNYKEKMRRKENVEKNLEELKDKFDKEKFENFCQINIWKKNFLSIAKYKLLNYSQTYDRNLIDVMKIDEKYIINCPESIKKLADKILNYFKELIDQEKENKEVSNDNEIVVDYKDKLNNLNNILNQEKKIRRKIFYKYLNLRNNISIMCRIRPFPQKENNEILINKNSQIDTFIIDKNSLIVKDCKINNNLKKYEFDYIFSENSTQQDIYEEIFPLIHSLFKGNDIIIISYGQRKSGKTFTILGDNNNIGITGRALQEIFYILNNSNKDKYSNYNVSFNMLNILNDEIYNLLEESTPKMEIKENDKGELLINDLISVNIKTYDEFDKLIKLAKIFQKNSKNINKDNNNTNFSNYIYSFNINITEKDDNSFISTLTLIDLGDDNENKEEDIQKSDEIKEKNADNTDENKIPSSLYLQDFLKHLVNKNIKDYQDWNKNILVHYLKRSIISNNYKLLLMLNISPDIDILDDTLKTLQFGENIFSEINKKPL